MMLEICAQLGRDHHTHGNSINLATLWFFAWVFTFQDQPTTLTEMVCLIS